MCLYFQECIRSEAYTFLLGVRHFPHEKTTLRIP